MVDLSLLQSVSYIAGALGVCVAGLYYVMNLRMSQKNQELSLKTQELAYKAQEQTLETRQAQLFMQIFQRFNEPDFFDKYTTFLSWKWKDYDDFMSKYGQKANPEAWYSEGSVAAFFNGVGLLLYMNLVDIKLIYGLLFVHVKLFWKKIGPVSQEMRKRLNYPQIDQWVEYLYEEIIEYDKKTPLHLKEPKLPNKIQSSTD
jgi:hypothetical protein